MTATGWSLEHCRHHVTLSGFNRLVRYWSKHPPSHLILAAVNGLTEPEPELTYENESVESLFGRWGGANDNTGGSPFGVEHGVALPDWVPKQDAEGPYGHDAR